MDFKKIALPVLLLASTSAQATLLNFANEAYGSLGPSITTAKDGVSVKISAFKYNSESENKEVSPGILMGIDGIYNERHPAGLGAAKSEEAHNPPGIDNVAASEIEFVLFEFDKPVKVTYIENTGLGPHRTGIDYWGGHHHINPENFSILDLGNKYSLENTTPGFAPDDAIGVVTWFAMGATPSEEAYNVLSMQTFQFTESTLPQATVVPLPAAVWMFLAATFSLVGIKTKA